MKTQEELLAWNERRLALQRARKKRWKERNREAFRAQRRRWKNARRERKRLGITLSGSSPLTGDGILSKYLRVQAASAARKDYHRAYSKAWFAAHPVKRREYNKRHYWKHLERHRAEAREATHKRYARTTLICMVDPQAYANHRAKSRVQIAKNAVKNGRTYKPRFARRIPDWCVKGQFVIDVRSPWLIENLTPSQRAYARELAIERKEWRDR